MQAWRRPLPTVTFRWLVLDWVASIAALALALVVAVVNPIAGLVMVAVGSIVATATVARVGPERGDWF